MIRRLSSLALLSSATAIAGCGPSPDQPPPNVGPERAAALPPPGSRRCSDAAQPDAAQDLRLCSGGSGGDVLFVTAKPDSYPRGTFLYVLDPEPLVPGGPTHLRIGLVQVVEPKPVTVSWYCHPKRPPGELLTTRGLPVEPFTPDTTVRVGKCWGRHVGQEGSAWTGQGVADLALNLGQGDGVKEGDLYEILGEPNVDPDNRTITGFVVIGRCAVLPFVGSVDRSVCRLDSVMSPKFDKQWWVRGGFVHLEQREP